MLVGMTGLFVVQKYVAWPVHHHAIQTHEASLLTSGIRHSLPPLPVRVQKVRPDSIQEVSGNFVRIQPIQLLGKGLSRGIALVLESDGDPLVLYLGSESLDAIRKLQFTVGDRITAKALPVEIDGREMFLPAEVKSPGQRLQLMDEEQLVMWRELTQSLPQNGLSAQQLR